MLLTDSLNYSATTYKDTVCRCAKRSNRAGHYVGLTYLITYIVVVLVAQ